MELFLIVGAYGLICFLIGEFFGRAKHIGRWWTMFLFWSSPIPIIGMMALIFSPKADKEVKKNKVLFWAGVILCGLAIVPLINIIMTHASGKTGSRIAFRLGWAYTYFTMFVLHGIYFIRLGLGRIRNKNPKNYFKRFKKTSFRKTKKSKRKNNYQPVEDYFYFIQENEKELGPLTYSELRERKIDEKTWVWRKGLDKWITANELEELEPITVLHPPVFESENEVKLREKKTEEERRLQEQEKLEAIERDEEKQKWKKDVLKRRRAIKKLSIYRKIYYSLVTLIIAIFLLFIFVFLIYIPGDKGVINKEMPFYLLLIVFVIYILSIPTSIYYLIKEGYNHKEKWARVNIKLFGHLIGRLFVFGIKTIITYSILVLIGFVLNETLLRRNSKVKHSFHLSHFIKNNSDTLSMKEIDVFIGEDYGEPTLYIENSDGVHKFINIKFYLKDYQEKVDKKNENNIDSIVKGSFITGKLQFDNDNNYKEYPFKGEFEVHYFKGKDVKNVFKLTSVEKGVSYSSENVNNWEVIKLSRFVRSGRDFTFILDYDPELAVIISSNHSQMISKNRIAINRGLLSYLKFDKNVSFEQLIARGKEIRFNCILGEFKRYQNLLKSFHERGVSSVSIQRKLNTSSINDVIIQITPISGDGREFYMEGKLESIRFNGNQKNDH